MIDAGSPKPPEVKNEHWNFLMANRATEGSKAKSEKMRAISKGKGSKAAQMKAIEKAALIKLVSFIYFFPRKLSLYVLCGLKGITFDTETYMLKRTSYTTYVCFQ